MSKQNKMFAQRFYDEVIGTKNLSVLDELCAQDIVDHNPLPGQSAGLQGVKKVMGEYFQAFPDLSVTVDEMVAEDDLVVARFRGQGTHKGPLLGTQATGKRVSLHGIDMFRIQGGKAVEVWHEGNDVSVLMELGVPVSA